MFIPAAIVAAICSTQTPATTPSTEDPKVGIWGNPFIFDAKQRPNGPMASVAGYYADYRGRKMEVKELTVGYTFSERYTLWYGLQNFLVKGRASTSRFRLDADMFGIRAVLIPVTGESGGLAIEYQGTRPSKGTATAVSGGGLNTAIYNAPKIDTIALDGSDTHGYDAQLSITSVDSAGGSGTVVGFGLAREFRLSPRAQLRAQGQLLGQSYTDVVEHVNLELKPVLYGAVGYDASRNFRLEADATLMPSGVPLASGSFSSLGSFQLYRPGGAAEGLRHNIVGFASLRLLYHGKL